MKDAIFIGVMSLGISGVMVGGLLSMVTHSHDSGSGSPAFVQSERPASASHLAQAKCQSKS